MQNIVIVARNGQQVAEFPFNNATKTYHMQYHKGLEVVNMSVEDFRRFNQQVNTIVQRYYTIPQRELDSLKMTYLIVAILIFLFIFVIGIILGLFFWMQIESKEKEIKQNTETALRNFFQEYQRRNITILLRGFGGYAPRPMQPYSHQQPQPLYTGGYPQYQNPQQPNYQPPQQRGAPNYRPPPQQPQQNFRPPPPQQQQQQQRPPQVYLPQPPPQQQNLSSNVPPPVVFQDPHQVESMKSDRNSTPTAPLSPQYENEDVIPPRNDDLFRDNV